MPPRRRDGYRVTRAQLLERMEAEMYEPMPAPLKHNLVDDLARLMELVRSVADFA